MLDTIQVSNRGLDVMAVISQANLAESTKRNYRAAVGGYIETGGGLFDAVALARYAQDLSNGTRAQLKAAVRLYSNELLDRSKAQAEPANVADIQAAGYRVEALQNAVKVTSPKGQKTHTWLSQAQVKGLLDSCGDDLQGERNRLVLGLLVAGGLRRGEVVTLTFDDVKLQPVGDGMRAVLAVEGKGKKRRTVPISDSLADAIGRWGRYVGHTGRILRSLDQRGELRESMSGVAVFNLVRKYGAAIGKPALAPHDLRRTYARLGYDAGVDVGQISILLGHSSIQTTQRYLGLNVDLEMTISDFVPF